jgi:hypothetical protein
LVAAGFSLGAGRQGLDSRGFGFASGFTACLFEIIAHQSISHSPSGNKVSILVSLISERYRGACTPTC